MSLNHSEGENPIELIMQASFDQSRLFRTDSTTNIEFRCFALEDLPITTDVKPSLKAWCEIYQFVWSDRFPWPRFSSDEDFHAFDQEGLRIWQKIREEMSPRFRVYYYSHYQEGLFRDPRLPMVRRVNLEPDYHCYPLWEVDDIGDFPPEDLPLQPETIQKLYAWAEKFDNSLDWNDPGKGQIWSQQEEEAFMQEGLNLWQQLKHELFPEYEVYYCLTASYLRLPSRGFIS